jgi:centromere protein I
MLSNLEKAILQGANAPFDVLFDFYGKLVLRWIDTMADRPSRNQIQRQLFRGHVESLQSHVATMMLSALVSSERPAAAVVTYLDRVSASNLSAMTKNPRVEIPIMLPQVHTYYLLLMSSSLSTLSRVVLVLKRYKVILGAIVAAGHSPPSSVSMATFNGFMVDTCNLLYRSRAFVSVDANAAGCLCPEQVFARLQLHLPEVDREYSLASMFGFSCNPVLSSIAHAAFQEMERHEAVAGARDETGTPTLEVLHQGPVSQRSLVVLANEGGAEISWKDYRIKVLRWLAERGLGGLEEFMFSAVKDLAAAK